MGATTITDDTKPIVVATNGLKKTYFGKIETPVLHGIDIEVRAGEFVAIMGQSGSGKSTLLNILGALDVPTEGRVLIDGVDIRTLSEDGLAALRNRVIGFVFQFHYLLDELSCLENALTPITMSKGEASEEEIARVIGLLKRVGVGIATSQTSGYDEWRAESTLRYYSGAGEPAEDSAGRRTYREPRQPLRKRGFRYHARDESGERSRVHHGDPRRSAGAGSRSHSDDRGRMGAPSR